MFREVGRHHWYFAAIEIAGAAANDEMLLAEPAGDQTRVGEFSAANGDIQPLCDQIGHTIFKVDIQFYLGISFNEGRQDRHQQMTADNVRDTDAQAPPRALSAFYKTCLRIF